MAKLIPGKIRIEGVALYENGKVGYHQGKE